MNFFNFKKIIFITVIIIIPLIFINIPAIQQSFIFKTSSAIVRSIQLSYFNYVHSVSQTTSHFTFLTKIKKNNLRLRQENAQLKIHLMKMKELQLENDRLRDLLKFKKQMAFNLLPAFVIAKDPFPEYYTIIINKGYENGVKKNMLALVESGLIGYVLSTKKNTAQILLLSDRSAILPVMVQRSRAHGLLEGHRSFLKLNYLEKDDVQIGDLIITSSITPHLPPGLPVGIVENIQKNEYELKPEIQVRPLSHFSNIKELFIILWP